jgi:hypothetical protein
VYTAASCLALILAGMLIQQPEEESRKNFQAIQRVVASGNVRSRLLLHVLDEKAGGDFYHNGGKHFASQNDPEWLTLRAWVLGQTAK